MLAGLKGVTMILFFALGFLQFFAFIAGLQEAMDVGVFGAVVISLLVSFIPFIGTVAGIYGAIEGWGWETLPAVALFVGPFAVILLISFAEVYSGRR